MSNKTETVKEKEQSTIELLKSAGTITLQAPTREELAAKVKELKASSDVRLSFGAVAQAKGHGVYSIRIDIPKK